MSTEKRNLATFLEKRNHIKKHVRKLRLSGVITSDPFEILHAEKEFYESLYKPLFMRNKRKRPFIMTIFQYRSFQKTINSLVKELLL